MEMIYPVFVSYMAPGLVLGMTYVFLSHPIDDPHGMTEMMTSMKRRYGSSPAIIMIHPMRPVPDSGDDEQLLKEYLEAFQCQVNPE